MNAESILPEVLFAYTLTAVITGLMCAMCASMADSRSFARAALAAPIWPVVFAYGLFWLIRWLIRTAEFPKPASRRYVRPWTAPPGGNYANNLPDTTADGDDR